MRRALFPRRTVRSVALPGVLAGVLFLALAPVTADRRPHQTSPEIQVQQLLVQGIRLAEGEDALGARPVLDEALDRARARTDAAAEAEARRGLGLVHTALGDYARALAELDAARALFDAIGDRRGVALVSLHLAAVARIQYDAATARARLAEALAGFDALQEVRGRALVLSELPSVAENAQAREAAIRDGLAVARGADEPRALAKLLHAQGDLLRNRGDFVAAHAAFHEAIAIFERLDHGPAVARVWVSLGWLLREHGRMDEALPYHRRALAVMEETQNAAGIALGRGAIGWTLRDMGRSREAVRYFNDALASARASGSLAQVTHNLKNVGWASLDAGDARRALAVGEELLGHARTDAARTPVHDLLAQAHLELQEHERALAHADRAVTLRRADGILPDLVASLARRARALEGLDRLDAALADVQDALTVLEGVRPRQIPKDSMKSEFGDVWHPLFALAVRLNLRAGRPRDALEAAERGRARAFLDLVAAREIGVAGPAGPGADRPSPLAAPPASVDDIIAVARRFESTVLTYFVTADATFAWATTPAGTVHAARIPVASRRLADLVTAATSPPDATAASGGQGASVVTRGGQSLVFGTTTGAWRDLHDLLIEPIAASVRLGTGARLTIVPHGPLLALPFAALRDARGRYLLERVSVHYAPAAGVFPLAARRDETLASGTGHAVFVADPAALPLPPDGRQLPALPYSRREVQAASRLFGDGRATLLVGGEATEENVRRAMAGASLVHLATHGIVRDDQPLSSFLALGASGAAAESDGRLTAEDIYAFDLAARLVVLSACRTGVGRVSADGVLGFTRSFFSAGAPAVVATLWDVADEPTEHVMSAFYRRLAAGAQKDHALREAQLALLGELRAGRVVAETPLGPMSLPEHPLLWAGFVMLGETSPLKPVE